ncbi:MAG TPA: phosphate-starvation-inducible PsiE family protein [Kofleriaceae bacterium]|nr:phosphate-starvation-inducible PsiE family protein [Kofleriaceae bacterium]
MASAHGPDEVLPGAVEPDGDDERFVRVLDRLIHWAVRLLAVLMVAIIFLGIAEAAYTLYRKVLEPPVGLLDISNIFATFGGVIAVLIAIEIFHNVVLYLRKEVIHIRIVMATAVMAIARKVIVLDFHDVSATYVFGAAAVMLAVGVSYYLIVVRAKPSARP